MPWFEARDETCTFVAFYCFRRRRDKPLETNLDLPSGPAPAAGVLAGDTILAAGFLGERLTLTEFGFPTHRGQVQRLAWDRVTFRRPSLPAGSVIIT
jgi:hypothetical protein